MEKKVVIAGGTGFIGLSLAQFLTNNGYKPILLARSNPKTNVKFDFVSWDAHSLGDWTEALEGCHAVVNLAGRTVDCIKTPDNRDLILRSRVDSTIAIGKALQTVKNKPGVWVQMSTAHIYGDPPKQMCTESSSFGMGLAPTVGQAWEKAFLENKPDEIRGVRLRTSFVIGKNGGALASLSRIVKLGMGGTVGKGQQGMSWIHEYDMNNLILQSIEQEKYNDFYIASAPNPVSNKVFMKKLRSNLRIPIGLPAPEWLTRFGAKYVFRTDPELALYGRYVRSERLDDLGFEFKYPDLDAALHNLIKE